MTIQHQQPRLHLPACQMQDKDLYQANDARVKCLLQALSRYNGSRQDGSERQAACRSVDKDRAARVSGVNGRCGREGGEGGGRSGGRGGWEGRGVLKNVAKRLPPDGELLRAATGPRPCGSHKVLSSAPKSLRAFIRCTPVSFCFLPLCLLTYP